MTLIEFIIKLIKLKFILIYFLSGVIRIYLKYVVKYIIRSLMHYSDIRYADF